MDCSSSSSKLNDVAEGMVSASVMGSSDRYPCPCPMPMAVAAEIRAMGSRDTRLYGYCKRVTKNVTIKYCNYGKERCFYRICRLQWGGCLSVILWCRIYHLLLLFKHITAPTHTQHITHHNVYSEYTIWEATNRINKFLTSPCFSSHTERTLLPTETTADYGVRNSTRLVG